MNPTSAPTLSNGQIVSPIPANFDRWPKSMQDRYRRHVLAPPTPSSIPDLNS